MAGGRVVIERDEEAGIARLTLDNPSRRNAYDPPMRDQLGAYLDDLATDDAIKVVLLRGEGGVFSTGADMGNAYTWYETDGAGSEVERPSRRRPSQRRRLAVDRSTFDFYHNFLGYPKVTVAEVRGYALGGGFELALMADISVVAGDARVGMPATRLLGPALGTLHLFFHRLGPTLARRLLLTGDTIPASELAHLSIFTEVVDDAAVGARADWWARKVAAHARRRPRPGQGGVPPGRADAGLPGGGGRQLLDPCLRHEPPVRGQRVQLRANEGAARDSRAFELRDAHFDVPEP